MAAPNPERELQRLQQRLAGGLPELVTLLGPGRFFREQAVQAVLALVGDRQLRMIDGTQAADASALLDLRGGGLFGGGTVVVVRRGDDWLQEHGDALLEVLPKIKSGCALALELDKLDRRTKLGRALAARELFEFRELYAEPYDRTRSPLEAELVQWLGERSRRLGLPLSAQACGLLVTTVGKDPGELLAEVERLRPQLAGRPQPVAAAELEGRLSCSFESTPFEFAQALLQHDHRRCLRSLHAMFARGVRGRDGDAIDEGGVFPFLVNWTAQALAQVHEGRWLLDRGVAARDLPARLGVHVFQERLLDQVRRNSEPWLRHAYLRFLQAQRDLRLTGEEPRWILERAVGDCLEREGA
jgi:DNA polymerase III delta subunit